MTQGSFLTFRKVVQGALLPWGLDRHMQFDAPADLQAVTAEAGSTAVQAWRMQCSVSLQGEKTWPLLFLPTQCHFSLSAAVIHLLMSHYSLLIRQIRTVQLEVELAYPPPLFCR